jgi:hypothetical protein
MASKHKRNRRLREQPNFFGNGQIDLPSFASTPEEIRQAVEANAIQRGILFVKVIMFQDFDGLIETVERLAAQCDREDFYEAAPDLGIDVEALRILDNASTPVPYPYYFCTPIYLIEYPELVRYYRNVAMLSQKVMGGIGLGTSAYEERKVVPTEDIAFDLTRYFNGIVNALIQTKGSVTPYGHIQMAFSNMGDSLGGMSRNEIGRIASGQIVRMLASHLHQKGLLNSIIYRLKGRFDEDEESTQADYGDDQILFISPNHNLEMELSRLDDYRVKYREITLNNGNRLLINRQLEWSNAEGKSYKIGPDMVSQTHEIDLKWAGELKGGADPAGSDEHWKTATQALGRIREACEKTGRPKPELSFIATIIVERVAIEAQQWIEQDKLTSVYNLTRIINDLKEKQKFLDAMTSYLGF